MLSRLALIGPLALLLAGCNELLGIGEPFDTARAGAGNGVGAAGEGGAGARGGAGGTGGSLIGTAGQAQGGSAGTVDPGVTPRARTLFGIAFDPPSDERYLEVLQEFGPLGIRRSYGGESTGASFLERFQPQDVAHGVASAYSFRLPSAEVLAGTHDAALTQFFSGMEDGHPVFWTYWPTPEDVLFVSQDVTPSEYRAAWAHIRELYEAVKANRPELEAFATLLVSEYALRPEVAPTRPMLGESGMYPGDDVIDVIGLRAANEGWSMGRVTAPIIQFQPAMDFARQHGKRWAVSDLGSCEVAGDPNGRAKYLQNAIDYWASQKDFPVYASYDHHATGGCDFTLDAAGITVWSKAVRAGVEELPP